MSRGYVQVGSEMPDSDEGHTAVGMPSGSCQTLTEDGECSFASGLGRDDPAKQKVSIE